MGATATALQWTVGVVLALGVVALLIAPFAAVWVIGLAVASLVAVGVWAFRFQRRSSSTTDHRPDEDSAGAERPAARASLSSRSSR